MKRFIAISFLLLYLFTATELSQLLKFPILIEHFVEHKELNHDLSFLDFLNMHYADHPVKDSDYDRDMQLPFKSHDHCVSANFQSLPTHFETISLHVIPVLVKNTTLYKDFGISSSFLSTIWQPPKSC